MRAFLIAFLPFLIVSQVFAEPTQKDRLEIHKVIERQIAAFRNNDAKTAFSYASPKIRLTFRTAEVFMSMVRRGYPQIYRAAKVSFLALEETNEGVIQRVLVTGQNGSIAIARYRMELRNGRWLINGCKLDRGGAI